MAEKEYRSNYENVCADCGQPIKPQTPYLLRKGQNGFERVHVECPEGQASERESAPEAKVL